MHSFYYPECEENSTRLPADETKHALKSLRLKAGDGIQILNGKGGVFKAKVKSASREEMNFDIIGTITMERESPQLHLALSPLKFVHRFESLIEKVTELEVSEITPLLCERSEKKSIRTKRILNIMISAIKQSGNPFLPKLNKPLSFESFVSSEQEGVKIIAHCGDGEKIFLRKIKPGRKNIALIGPEGDFTPGEVAFAESRSYLPITLGNSVLRSETAGIMICSYFHIFKK